MSILWPHLSLGDLTKSTRPICYGVLKPGPFEPEGAPLLRVVDLANNRVELSAVHRISPALDAEFRRSRLRGGEVLLSIQGTVGRVALVPKEAAGANISRTLAVIEPDERVDARFLRYFLLSFRQQFKVGGTTRASLNIGDLRQVAVPVPPLDEQQRIVAVLEDHLSRLDAGGNYASAAAKRLCAFETQVRDGAVRANSQAECRLSDLIERVEAGRSFGEAAGPARAGEWGVVKVSAMTWGEFRASENKAVAEHLVDPRWEIRSGDVLVSRANTREYVGAPVLVRDVRPRLLLSDKSLRLVPRASVAPAWLVAALATTSARRQVSALASGTKDSMRNISQVHLQSIRLPRASVEQQADALRTIMKGHEAASRLGAALDQGHVRQAALRRSLLVAAFSGHL